MQHQRARRTAIAATMAVIAAVAIAACGSSSAVSTTSASNAAASASTGRTKLAACLRQHGVTLPARATGGQRPGSGQPPAGGGYGGYGGAGGNGPGGQGGQGGYGGGGGFFGGANGGAGGPKGAQSTKFRAAFKACGAAFGAGRGRLARGGPGAQPSSAALVKFTACVAKHGYKLPKANTSGSGPIFPKKIESNQKFEAAAKACQTDLRPSPAGSGTSGSTGSND